MVTHMKTTIEIPDSLFRRMKEIASERHTTLKALVEAALRQVVESEDRPRKRFRLRNLSVKGKGLQPGVRDGRWTDIRSLIYEGQGG